MKLVVGLGNPGKEYEKTRHNVGFMVIDNYLGDVQYKKKFTSYYYEKNINGEKVAFIKPQTFMNESGVDVKNFANYYKIKEDDILIIHDDMDFSLGTFKYKNGGSSGGHNGIKSIISYFSADRIKRLRVGISKNSNIDVINYVLGKFSSNESEILRNTINKVCNSLDDYFSLDYDKLMSKYNVR